MDATVLLLLVCCWKLTEERGEVESEITEGAPSKSMDFPIPTTPEHNTLQPSFHEKNTVRNSEMIQEFDTTTIPNGTEAEQFVSSYEDGKAGLATSKETNTSRGFIEEEYQNLRSLNETIDSLYEEASERVWNFIVNETEIDMDLALNKIMKIAETVSEYVNRSKELNINIDIMNSSAANELKIKDLGEMEGELRAVLDARYQLDKMSTLIVLSKKFEALTVEVEYKGDKYVSDLEDTVTALREMIEVLRELVHVTKELLNFINNFKLVLDNFSEYTEESVSLELWETELQNQKRDLTHYEKLLEEQMFILHLTKFINPATRSVIFVTGVLGNGLLLVVFAMHGDMRTSPNLMVLNLALGDFLSLICNILVYDAVEVAGGAWPHGLPLCRTYHFFRHLSIGVTVYSIVVISAQRFFALAVFLKWHGCGCRLLNKYQSLIIIGFVWLLATAVAVPRTVNAEIYDNRCLGHGPENSAGHYRLVASIDFIALCVLPLAFIAVLSGATAKRIKDSIKDMPGETSGREKIKQARLLSSNILITLALVFSVCYVPYFLYAFLNAWLRLYEYVDYTTHLSISFFTFSLIFANSCFNPIAIYIASRKYRIYMKKYLLCKCRKLANQKDKKISTETSTTLETHL